MIINLAGVTKTLENLIVLGVQELAGVPLPTNPRPPDAALPGEISVHLFHGIESPEYKNFSQPGISGKNSVKYLPMGLILQYIISMPVGAGKEESSVHLEYDGQRVLGYIARVLHDYPVVDEKLELPNESNVLVPVLDSELQGARLEFNLRPVKIEENISFWSAEQTFAPRFSLFVEARVILLEPRPPALIPGRVLSIGGGVMASRGPELLAGKSSQTFPVPQVTGLISQTASLSPPRPTLLVADQSAGPSFLPPSFPSWVAENNRVHWVANGLVEQRWLVLQGEGLDLEVPLDRPLAENAPWDFLVTGTTLSFRVWSRLYGMRRGTSAREFFEITPGSYSLRIVQKEGALGSLSLGSTPLAFLVVPQTLGIVREGNEYNLRVAGAYLKALEDEVSLFVGGERYELSADSSPGEREFVIESAAEEALQSNLRFVLSSGQEVSPRQPLNVQLIVRGANATPEWLEE